MKSFNFISFIPFLLFLAVLSASVNVGKPLPARIPVERIVSLSPSITDQINDLDATRMLAGVTMYSPENKGNAEIIGNYIRPDIEKMISLRPDIVFYSEEDSAQSGFFPEMFGLRSCGFGRARDFEKICENYTLLASMIGRKDIALFNLGRYRQRLGRLAVQAEPPGVVFLVSAKPLITVSGSSYISSIISAAGGKNLFASEKNPYPILNMEALIMTDPDLVLVMNSVDKDYLCEALKDFPSAGFVRKKNIFVTGDTTVPYYSPGKYVESAELIAKIIAGMNR